MVDSNRVVVGSAENCWIWSRDLGWDLTHPKTPESRVSSSQLLVTCEISNITIDPLKTALLVIDMQNYSLSSALGNEIPTSLLQAETILLEHGIPAARKAGIQVIWLNWGLTEEDLKELPPSTLRVFGWKARCDAADYGVVFDNDAPYTPVQCGEAPRATAPGMDLGQVDLGGGNSVAAGCALMRDTRNTALHDPLLSAYADGLRSTRPDVLVHKNRNSGLSGADSYLAGYLRREEIRTLLFAGMNTDQCVMATLQDAHAQGFDTILLKDACATDSPSYAQHSALYNCCRNWGFLTTCKALASAVSCPGPTERLGLPRLR